MFHKMENSVLNTIFNDLFCKLPLLCEKYTSDKIFYLFLFCIATEQPIISFCLFAICLYIWLANIYITPHIYAVFETKSFITIFEATSTVCAYPTEVAMEPLFDFCALYTATILIKYVIMCQVTWLKKQTKSPQKHIVFVVFLKFLFCTISISNFDYQFIA